jgi:hypothetical protein
MVEATHCWEGEEATMTAAVENGRKKKTQRAASFGEQQSELVTRAVSGHELPPNGACLTRVWAMTLPSQPCGCELRRRRLREPSSPGEGWLQTAQELWANLEMSTGMVAPSPGLAEVARVSGGRSQEAPLGGKHPPADSECICQMLQNMQSTKLLSVNIL